MRHYNIPVFVPHLGCPNDCSFCNQKRITGQKENHSIEKVREDIEKTLSTISGECYVEIAFFGGSFTGIPEEEQIRLLKLANDYVKKGKVNGIRLSTRPDYINCHILDYLKEYGVTAIELGVQSMVDEVLMANDRGHLVNDVENAVRLIKRYGCFQLGLQQMTGLYKSDREKDILSAEKIASLHPKVVRIYPTIVLPSTKLEKLYAQGKYIPYTLEEAVEVCSKIYRIYEKNNIQVIRMGLQATEMICEKGENIIGPYHSSFGELVLSRILRDELEEKLKNCKEKAEIVADKSIVSKIVGNKRCNIEYFKEKYGIELQLRTENFPENTVEKYYINITKG
ncbi:MAG: radical SAM protein [Clostridia bacterium]|nr:radical SAM protein [Clostridia bacterium]